MRASVSHLEQLDLFRGLGDGDKADLAARFTYRTVNGGQRLIREGEEARDLYIVVSGRFAVTRGDGPTLAVIGRGEPVGEIAFFNGGRRTADVTAQRDSEILCIERTAFDALADSAPMLWRSAVLALTERLVKATANTVIERVGPAQPRTVVLCPAGDGPLPADFAARLLAALTELGCHAMVLSERILADATGQAPLDSPEANQWLAAREADHDLTLWLAGDSDSPWARKAVRQADAALLVSSGDASRSGALEQLVAERLDPGDIRLAVISGQPSVWRAHRTVGASYRAETPREIAALARFLCGKARGLVLGGGGALGGAHVGVFAALKEAGVSFDSFAGASAGGALGGAMAMGLERAEIVDRCEDIFLTNRALKRWTVPRHGLVDPATVDRMLRHHYGTGMIEDMPYPFLATATDLSDNAMHVMDRGPLWQAIRATCSIPVLLPPFIDAEGRILVDGGITDNLPIDPMRMTKRGPNLAVMLGQSRWRRADFSYDEMPARSDLLLEKLLPWRKPRIRAPRVGQVMTRTMLLASDGASQDALTRAETVFLPPIPKGMGIIDWKRFRRLEADTYEWAQAEIERRLAKDPTALDAFR